MCCMLSGEEDGNKWMLVSADTRSLSGYKQSENTQKLDFPNSKVIVAHAGESSCAYEVYETFVKNNPTKGDYGVERVASALYEEFEELTKKKSLGGKKRGPLYSSPTGMLVGGFEDGKGRIYIVQTNELGETGIRLEPRPFSSIGSGSPMAIDTIGSWVNYFGGKDFSYPADSIEMPYAEGLKCLTRTHLTVPVREISVGPMFQVYSIKNGTNVINIKPDELPIEDVKRELEAQTGLFKLFRDDPETAMKFVEEARQKLEKK